MLSIGYLPAFLGGVLSLMSPCSALLLPSFFAYAFARPAALAARTGVFYAGLAATLVPLGAGSAAVSTLFYGHRALLILLAGWVIVGFGALQLLGGGFAIGPAVALQTRLQTRLRHRAAGSRGLPAATGGLPVATGGPPGGSGGLVAVFWLGASYGLAGFCSGPVLGAVLTVAAAQGAPLRGAALLAVYALGMAAPLFALALLWDRLRLGQRAWLRGRSWRLGPLRLHSTMLVSGLLFMATGGLFLAYDGTAGITGMLGLGGGTGTEYAAQRWAERLRVPDAVVLGGAAAVILVVAAWRLRAARREASAVPPATAAPPPQQAPGSW